MKKLLALFIVAAFLFASAASAQENPAKRKAKPKTEQRGEKGKSEAAQAEHKGTKGKSEEAKAKHKKIRKGKKQNQNIKDDRVPSVIRDRNIP